MSDYNWCHGPNCHKHKTQDRIRGFKGSKVLRTVKIAQGNQNARGLWNYFCDQTCMHDFFWKHFQEFVQLHPRPEALETPIEDPKKTTTTTEWGYTYTNTEIKEVDNNSNP